MEISEELMGIPFKPSVAKSPPSGKLEPGCRRSRTYFCWSFWSSVGFDVVPVTNAEKREAVSRANIFTSHSSACLSLTDVFLPLSGLLLHHAAVAVAAAAALTWLLWGFANLPDDQCCR